MFFIVLLFLTAFGLSAIAAYYSIVGLIAIFASAPIPIAIMGGSLEVAKLVTASWLYRNWQDAPRMLKYYFTSAVVVLMLITSLGIFGYLSKAHIDQTSSTSETSTKVAIYDEKIRTARENIEAARRQLKQMDEAVDQILARSTTEQGAQRANTIRRTQSSDRNTLAREIEANQKIIVALGEESAPLRAEVRKVEAEVGPLKYIAELIYGEEAKNHLDSAVRFVIILLVLVFDPLAVLMVIAGNYNLSQLRRKEEPEQPRVEAAPEPKMKETDINMTSVDPIPMNKDEIVNATKLYHRDQDSM
jgi:outer membrane murein-binding lipoprotein Lpp